MTYFKRPHQKEDLVPETKQEESLARFMCTLDGVDPELEIPNGLGKTIYAGFSYTLWEYRVPVARAILKWTEENK